MTNMREELAERRGREAGGGEKLPSQGADMSMGISQLVPMSGERRRGKNDSARK